MTDMTTSDDAHSVKVKVPLEEDEHQAIPLSSSSSQTAVGQRDSMDHVDKVGGDGRDHTLRKLPWQRKTTPWSTIISQQYDGEGTAEKPHLIDWVEAPSSPSSPTDESKSEPKQVVDIENPLTWSSRYQWTIVILASLTTLAVSMASSIMSAAIFDIAKSFPGESQESYIMGKSSHRR